MATELSNGQRSVGLGGWPDRDGMVTLDAAVMLDDARAGAVAAVRGVTHPVRLARWVMERTPHVMLVRVGDSPVVGSGLFVDRHVGGAVATGLGEAVLRTAGAHAIVELMRAGSTPQRACEALIHRMVDRVPGSDAYQVGVLAMDCRGRVGAFAVQQGFTYAMADGTTNAMHRANSALAVDGSIARAMKVKGEG